jgi:hypothetical protein
MLPTRCAIRLPPVEAPSIIANALQAELGLKVEAKKMPLDVLVVDKMDETQTDNYPAGYHSAAAICFG